MNKSDLREKYKELRKKLSPSLLQVYSEQIIERALSNFQLEGKTISLFLPIEKQREINTYQLLEKAVEFGAKVTIPLSNFDDNSLKHILYTPKTKLHINNYGIPEPTEGESIAPTKIDYVFVPLLAIDKEGNRVGYGKGFYDRFLSECNNRCIFIGLHLFELEEKIDDTHESDVKLHYVVTPEKVFKCKKA